MRDLASVCTIKEVWPLEGKDRVQGASMIENGYEAMVSKDIQPGQLVAFIQEGSILPVKGVWEWLRKKCFNERVNGFVIKAMKFATIKSWGLIVPLNEIGLEEWVYEKLKAGDDITELLEIRKFEIEEEASPTKSTSKKSYPKWIKFCLKHSITRWIGNIWQKYHKPIKGGFPSNLISKSDETTIQNMKGALEKFANERVYVSAKMEGQSFTVVPVFRGKKMISAYPCGRNTAFPSPDDTIFWKMMEKYNIIEKMKTFWKREKRAFIFQGEQVGPKIQQNIYRLPDNEWFVYTVKDYNTGEQLSLDEAVKITNQFGLRFVPIIEYNVDLKKIMPDVKTAVEYAEKAAWRYEEGQLNLRYNVKSEDKLWKDYIQHEGIVVRTMNYDKDKNIGCSFKIKNYDYSEKGLGSIEKIAKDMKEC